SSSSKASSSKSSSSSSKSSSSKSPSSPSSSSSSSSPPSFSSSSSSSSSSSRRAYGVQGLPQSRQGISSSAPASSAPASSAPASSAPTSCSRLPPNITESSALELRKADLYTLGPCSPSANSARPSAEPGGLRAGSIVLIGEIDQELREESTH